MASWTDVAEARRQADQARETLSKRTQDQAALAIALELRALGLAIEVASAEPPPPAA